jgi:hypothetical protein
MIYHGPETEAPPSDAEQAAMGEFMGDMLAKGWLLHADGLLTSRHGARVRQANGQVTVVDGPFTEAKEIVGGFAIVDVPSKEIAIDLAKRFLQVAGDGVSEVRQMHDVPSYRKS